MSADGDKTVSDNAVSRPVASAPGKEKICPICGAVLPEGQTHCDECGWFKPVAGHALGKTAPIVLRESLLKPQFDRLLVLAALLAFMSLYMPWLPGLYGSVPGWKVPYATPDVPLDEIRHLEEVQRPESIFLMNAVGILALLFCRTSRHAGLRDLVATVLLVAGGGYILVFFVGEWGWCLLYNYAGSYAAFLSLGLIFAAGLLRTKFMQWVPPSRVLLLVASAFLLTGFFLPWSLDQTGVHLMIVARHFYWLGVPKTYAYLMLVFPLLGFVGFIAAFREIPQETNFVVRLWPVFLGLPALVYFRAVWAMYLVGFPVGSWGTLLGLTILTAAGILDMSPKGSFFTRLLMWAFVCASIFVWLPIVDGAVIEGFKEFLSFGGPVRFQ